MKYAIFWCGVKGDTNSSKKYKYGDFSWLQYSKYTWEYWCKINNVSFLEYNSPTYTDHLKYKINWQRWFDVIPYLDVFDKILLTDASIMIKWDAPNIFNMYGDNWTGLIGNENFKWVYESINGYKTLFNNYSFDYTKHYLAGFSLFNQSHKSLLNILKEYYFDNHTQILEYENNLIKRGRDQPILNYILQTNNIITESLPISWGANHMWRRNILRNNNITNSDELLYIKYFNTWIFSGYPDRGKYRTDAMKFTWDLVKNNYE